MNWVSMRIQGAPSRREKAVSIRQYTNVETFWQLASMQGHSCRNEKAIIRHYYEIIRFGSARDGGVTKVHLPLQIDRSRSEFPRGLRRSPLEVGQIEFSR